MLSHLIIKLFPCILDHTFSGQQCWWPWPLRLQGVPLNSPIKSGWDQKVVRLGDQRGVLEPWLGANAISSHTFMHTQYKTHICIHILTHTHCTATDETPGNQSPHNSQPLAYEKEKIFLKDTFHPPAGGLKQEPVTWWSNHHWQTLITCLWVLKRAKSMRKRNSQCQHRKSHQGAINLYDAKKPGPPFFWLLAKMTLTLLPLDCQVRSGHMPQKTSLVPNSSSYTWVEDDKTLHRVLYRASFQNKTKQKPALKTFGFKTECIRLTLQELGIILHPANALAEKEGEKLLLRK